MDEFRFLYQLVSDLGAAVKFYTEELGFEEAWRDGDLSVAVWMPGHSAQEMLSTSGKPPGPMYLVENLDEWIDQHSGVAIAVKRDAAGVVSVAGLKDPAGNVFYVFDQRVT